MKTETDSQQPAGSTLCEHDWKAEYYGTRCSKCDTFYPFGSEPWRATDPALDQIQAIEQLDDEP